MSETLPGVRGERVAGRLPYLRPDRLQWGENGERQLGVGSTEPPTAPVFVTL